MDPQAAWNEILDKIAGREYADAYEQARDLERWIADGAFYPCEGIIPKATVHRFIFWVTEVMLADIEKEDE